MIQPKNFAAVGARLLVTLIMVSIAIPSLLDASGLGAPSGFAIGLGGTTASAAQVETDEAAASLDEEDAKTAKPQRAESTGRKRTAIILPFRSDINPISGALLKRRFQQAVDSGTVDVIILDIESPGGFTYVTFELMDMVLAAKNVETVAFIEKDAISGAALLSLSTDTILMKPDARIGDAGEIVMGEDGAFRYTEAKSRSVLAQKVRDTAAATGRPVALAEKMTDKDMVVYHATHLTNGEKRYISDKEHASMEDADDWELGKPIREAGKEMFFTANGRRAVELGIADQTVADRDELARVLNVATPIEVVEASWTDGLVMFLNFKFVTFLLLLIGLIGVATELSAPGLGIGGIVAVLCFGLFFWSRFLGGTSGWLEVTCFAMGILFIGAEIFVIPGFGVAGITGLALTLGSLVMASRRFTMPAGDADWVSLGNDILLVGGAFVGFLVVAAVLTSYMGSIPILNRLTLQAEVEPSGAVVMNDNTPAWQRVQVGQTGVSVSPLRPGGRVEVDEMMVDVVTEGDYVDSGQPVRVIAKQGARVVVRVVEEAPHNPNLNA
ncbi:NfeD family protein [Neorhodopirellula lusitana]|uniref:NfeD family protein n=1 Tax=Neorhodopirellula lusitana TaxID=445327 RepID=UPI00384CD870